MKRYLSFFQSAILLLLVLVLTSDDMLAQNESRREIAVLQDDEINEASGLISSMTHKGVFWTHNDSGDSARLFAVDSLGVTLHTLYLENVSARDWEDLSYMTDSDGDSFLLVAEIGDNRKQYDHYLIHKILEPQNLNESASRSEVETLIFKYEDGPQNAETLAYDEINSRLVIVNKGNTLANLYELPLEFGTADTLTATIFGTLDFDRTAFGGMESQGGVGGEIFGDHLLVKTYDNIYKSDLSNLSEAPLVLPYVVEVQGEALAWNADGSGYYTVSEERGGVPARIYYYELAKEAGMGSDLPSSVEYLTTEVVEADKKSILIRFKLTKPQDMQVFVEDSEGQAIAMILDEEVDTNSKEMNWVPKKGEVGAYRLIFVSDSFTIKREIELW